MELGACVSIIYAINCQTPLTAHSYQTKSEPASSPAGGTWAHNRPRTPSKAGSERRRAHSAQSIKERLQESRIRSANHPYPERPSGRHPV